MNPFLETFAWLMFFCVYGFVAAAIWAWKAKRHIAFVSSRSSPSFRYDVPIIALAFALGLLPPVALLLLNYWLKRSLSVPFIVVFCIAWLLAALPGIVKSRRIMRDAGLNPDAT